jgi:hypothetical protein
MKQSKKKKTAPLENQKLTAHELVEKELFVCILAHTNSLGEAEEYVPMTAAPFLARRIKYDIATPPRNSYGGPKLTQQEMVDAFFASRVTSAQAADSAAPPATPPSNVTFVPPTGPAGNVPPSALSTPV